jgi:uncharacterized repeat protein (TIGR04138 family)
MSLRNRFPRIIAGDPRFSIEAYAFVLEALDHARVHKIEALNRAEAPSPPSPRRSAKGKARGRKGPRAGHVTGRELCEAVRKLALGQYGLLAATVLAHWGIRSTSDIGDIVYNMIAAGDLEKTPSDSRADFNNVYDFASALKPNLALALDEPA